ncbi:MAG: PTS sugar transporter subunit IIB [Bacillota bacterium]|nr:PTS sugar transporter subunit IIB [Bacillota bacterium]
MIKLVRIDHRLMHGQVAFAWTNFIGADCILIANDAVAGDEFRKSTLRLAKPAGVKLVFKTIDDSIKSLGSGVTDSYKLFIILETIHDALRFIEGYPEIKFINLGLSRKQESSVTIGKAVYATPEEMEELKTMISLGVEIEMRQGPKDPGTVLKL